MSKKGIDIQAILDEEDRLFNEAHNIDDDNVIDNSVDIDEVYDFLYKEKKRKVVNEENVAPKKKISSNKSTGGRTDKQGFYTDLRLLFKKHHIDPDNEVAKQVIGNLMFNLHTAGFLKK
ncbi:MAG: hypothetical protein BWY04_01418 [candidate division CPR1 bacterium ADurb.Bin160]|uniref:Uncharacterized protein n=1 Tax=candidate division CPR1 bacterium ADurb.Bin160 TaxID=1852826 RepID=A0A1V5ZJ24_9BACT|nr:MAG: hypothetical protein BWY04_01418 [candidate division CPR1 bacterium ADurb.Bin160]